MMTPTARTLSLLRRRGYLADVVERWVPGANIHRDLFGCIDIVAIALDQKGVLGVQATSADHVSDRLYKAISRPALRTWLAAGNAFQVWGWRRQGRKWYVRVVDVRPDDLKPVEIESLPRRRGGRRPKQQQFLFDGEPQPGARCPEQQER